MTSLDTMLLVIAAGFLLLGVGFANRAKGWGVSLIALGWLYMLSTVAYKMYITFGERPQSASRMLRMASSLTRIRRP